MSTIGDVLMVFGGFAAVGLCAWALLVAVHLLFNRVAEKAAAEFRQSSPIHLLLGVASLVIYDGIALVLFTNPLPVLKGIGMLMAVIQVLIGAVGATGLVQILAKRVDELLPTQNHFFAMTRSAALVVIICLLPLIGWFAVLPLLHACSLSVGMAALFRKAKATAVIPPPTLAGGE